MNTNKKEILVNDEIKSEKIMLFDDQGEKLGLMSLREALFRADEKQLDVMQVGESKENVAICRMLNFEKWQYQEQKKIHKQEVKNRSHTMKEMRFRQVTGEHDMDIKINKCRDFLLEGHKLKVFLEIKGREHQNRLASESFLNKVTLALSDISIVDVPPKYTPKGLAFGFRPEVKHVKETDKEPHKEPHKSEVKVKM